MIPHNVKLFGSKYITKEVKDIVYVNRTMPKNKLPQVLLKNFPIPLLNNTILTKTEQDILELDTEKVLKFEVGIVNGGNARFLNYFPKSKDEINPPVKSYRLEIEENKIAIYFILDPFKTLEEEIAKANYHFKEFVQSSNSNLKMLLETCKSITDQEFERLAPIVVKQLARNRRRMGSK